MQVLVHGGAGSNPEASAQRQERLDDSARQASGAATAIEAVAAAVRKLESSPGFNAGVGGAVQSDGAIRTDAGLMTGDGRTGGACAMPGVEHAVAVARAVATETPHVLLAGDRAVAFAESVGVATDRNLWTRKTRTRWEDLEQPESDAIHDQLVWVRKQFGGTDTVGAVATDGEEIAAATSTGGRWCALAGRVGDVPQIGAGFYASERAAVSATGAGEAIARFGLARRVVDAIEDGDDPQTAADRAIRGFEAKTGAHAGVIAVDSQQRTGKAFNSESMQTSDAPR